MGEQLVRDILTPGVIGVGPETSLAHALGVMRANRISCLVILEAQKPLGILTERNILEAAARWDSTLGQCRVDTFMSSPVVTVTARTHVYEAYQLLTRHMMRHLVVVNEQGEAEGVATLSDLVEMLERSHEAEVKTISQIMNQVILTASPQSPVQGLLHDMADRHVTSVVAVEDDRPVGILTERDVVGLIADGCDLSTLRLNEVMSSPVHAVEAERPAHEVAALMRREHIRRLVVVNDSGRITGLITQSDIVRGLESNYLKILKGFLFEREDRLAVAGDALRMKSNYLENVLRSSELGIVTTDENLMITSFNPAAEAVFGVREGMVTGRGLRDVHREWCLAPDRLGAVLEVLDPHSSHEFEFRVNGPSPGGGRKAARVLHGRVSGVWSDEGEAVGYLLMLNDVTEKREAEENLAQLNVQLEQLVDKRTRDLDRKARQLEMANARLQDMDRLKSNFLSSVSHELRTPLTSLLGFAKIVARDFNRHFAPVATDSGELEHRALRIRDNLHIMGVESERLSRLINDYLDLAKIESGHMDWHDAALDPAEIVERAVVAAAGHFAARQGVDLEIRVDPFLPQVVADPDRIHQVLINLLSNAAKFTEKGTVTVLAEPRGGGVCFSVQDTGRGIAAQDIPLVFDKYRQAIHNQDTVDSIQPGTGLGLAICKEIVEHYGGFITVESEPDQGAMFSVFLPTSPA